MPAPREFTMNYNFKLVYTDIVYTISISSHETLNNLFDKACTKFEHYINLDLYYIDYVVAGQPKKELASAVSHHNLENPLWYEFGERWRQVSFYIRPINRNDNSFHRMDNYNVESIQGLVPETQAPESHLSSEQQTPELQNEQRDILGINLPSPPVLTR